MKVDHSSQKIVLHDEEIVTEYVDAARGPDISSMFVTSGDPRDLDRNDNNSNADQD